MFVLNISIFHLYLLFSSFEDSLIFHRHIRIFLPRDLINYLLSIFASMLYYPVLRSFYITYFVFNHSSLPLTYRSRVCRLLSREIKNAFLFKFAAVIERCTHEFFIFILYIFLLSPSLSLSFSLNNFVFIVFIWVIHFSFLWVFFKKECCIVIFRNWHTSTGVESSEWLCVSILFVCIFTLHQFFSFSCWFNLIENNARKKDFRRVLWKKKLFAFLLDFLLWFDE